MQTGIGIALGAAIGIALDNLALGIGIDIAVGAALGAGWQVSRKGADKPKD